MKQKLVGNRFSEILLGLMEDFRLEEIFFYVNDWIPYISITGYNIGRTTIINVIRESIFGGYRCKNVIVRPPKTGKN